MNPEYHEIYKEMLEEYQFGPRGFRGLNSRADVQSLRLIEKAVQEACDKTKVVLRPDAKFFLITNFHQMVALPVTIALGRQVRDTFSQMIREDIALIISNATESNEMSSADAKKEDEGISSGAILRTTAKLWDKLQTNSAWL